MSAELFMPPAQALDRVAEGGQRLALRLALAADAEQVRKEMAEALGEFGSGMFQYVLAAALEFLTVTVLQPLLAASESAGRDLRPTVAAILAGHMAGRAR